MKTTQGNIKGYLNSTFHTMKSRINLGKLLLVTGFWLLIAGKAIGQSCPTTPVISFSAEQNISSTTVEVCTTIQGGTDADHTDIDTRSGGTGGAGIAYHWQYSFNNIDWTTDPNYALNSNYRILSFFTTPGTYYFRLWVTNTACPLGVYSSVIVLHVNGTLPASPTASANPSSSCTAEGTPVSVTFTAANCTGNNPTIQWWNIQFGGGDNPIHSGSPWTTPINTTTTYWVSCRTGTSLNNYCESPRTPVTVTVGQMGNIGSITGLTTVCPGQSNVTYSIAPIVGANYAWNYLGTGASGYSVNSNIVNVNFTSGATGGLLSVTVTGCGSQSTNLSISVNPLPAPTVGTITQPNCETATGSVYLSGLPATGTWTLTPFPADIAPITQTGSFWTVTGLTQATTYRFTVQTGTDCISNQSSDIIINARPTPATPPIAGNITTPTCHTPGSVDLNGLPSGNWTLTRTPGGDTPGSGVTTTVSNLAPGTYTFTVTSESGCTSGPTNVIIPTNTDVPTAPVVEVPVQPTCSSDGSVMVSGLPTSGAWRLTLLPEGTFKDGSGFSINWTGLAQGTHHFTVTNQATCESGLSADVIIYARPAPPTPPSIGTITQPTCGEPTGSIALSGLPAGSWTLTSYPGGDIIWSGTDITLSGLAANQSYYFTVTTSPGCTSDNSATANIGAVQASPPAPTVVVTAQPTCALNTGTIDVSSPLGAYEYNLDGGAWQTSTTFSGVTPGSHTIRARSSIDIGCISGTTPISVNAQPLVPTAFAVTGGGAYCAGGTGMAVGLANSQSGVSYQLQLGGLDTGSPVVGTGSAISFGLQTAAGTYTVIATSTSAGNCQSMMTGNQMITITPIPPKPTVTITTQPTCTTPNATVQVSGWTGTAQVKRWPGGSVVALGTSPRTITLQPLGLSYHYTYQAIVVGSCQSADSDPIDILLPLLTANAGTDQTICSSASATLAGGIGGGAVSGTWSGGTGTYLPNNTTLNATYTPSAAEIASGTAALTLTANAVGSCPAVNDQVIITINPVATVNAGIDQTVCTISPIPLGGSIGGSATSATWSGGSGTFTPNNTTLNATYTPSAGEISAGTVTLTLTTNDPAGPCAAASDQLILTFYPLLVPGAHNTSPLEECQGYNPDSLFFNSPAISGGRKPYTYQWRLNGTNIAGATQGNYDPPVLTIPGPFSYNCIVLDACGSTFTTSPKVITIVPEPSVNISGPTSICQNEVVSLSADVIDGTGTYLYEWRSGPTAVGPWTAISGAINQLYSPLTSIAGTYYFQVHIYPAHPECNEATSSTLTFTVNPSLPASVNIAANPAGAICAGTSVIFTATPTNGGTTPTYQWKKGGVNIPGETGATYTTTTLANGDVITVTMTSNALCVSGSPATSPGITMTVNPSLPASVNIAANPAGAICAGTSVIFTATPTNGGTTPTYQWKKGGVNIPGETGATYTTTTLANGDVITVTMTSNALCVSGSPATSPGITMTVNPSLPASVNIAANPAGAICAGTSVIFTATPTNGGTTPTYQWKKGGVNIPGETGATYTTTTLANGDVITVTMTSNALCVSGSPATSPGINMTVNPSLPASVNIAANPAGAICAGTSVIFTATPTNGGTTPTYQWKKGGVNIPGETGATYTTTTLANGDVITVTMTSNALCVSGSPATSPGINMTVNPSLPASVNIAANPAGAICAGTSVIFTATPTNGGTTPTYQWKKGGVNIPGETGATYTTTTLANGDVITVTMTSNALCVSGSPATSPGINMTVNPSLPASVNIAANPAGAICAGTSVIFTATPTNGGTTPTYQWKKGGVNIPGETGATYTTTTLANGDVITVTMTSNALCVSGSPATSPGINMTVNPSLPASVNIAANPAGAICAGTSVIFTATPTNGGTTPTYQWKKGGVNIPGETGATYTTTTLANGDVITVTMTSNALCVSGSPATSPGINMTVNPSLPASVNIAANPAGAICAGTSVIFTATPTNGGTTPTYQWKKGGVNIPGETGATYTTTTLANGDVITVTMTSNALCVSGSPATSPGITMTVNPSLPASVNIAANPAGAICAGTSVIFTATPTNGGTTPTYQWKKGGVNIPGETGATYTTTTLANGDVITVTMTSNALCVSGSPATSPGITMTVNPSLPASVNIAANPAGAICAGTSVIFTATPTNGGTTPTYQWKKGGVNIPGETGATYTTTTLANGDVITVTMTSNALCVSGSPATSPGITMTVNPSLPASVNIAANPAGAICAGTSVIFTATPTNGGTTPTYQWKKGGVNIPGETGATYTTTTLANGDVITVTMTSNALCVSGSPATSPGINMTVNPSLPASVNIAANPAGAICAGTSVIFTATPTNGGTTPTYQWKKGGVNIPGETGATYTTTTLANGDVITVTMTSNALCVSGPPATSPGINMTVNPSLPASVNIAANPAGAICAGTSVIFTATPTNGGTTPTYQWKKGGVNIPGETGATYTTTTLANGDVITVTMTSNALCVSGSPATSPGITMTVNPSLPASVNIAANPAGAICAGTSVIFTATPTNGGTTPTYQWKKGGVNIPGETGATYTTTTLANGDVITVTMTSNALCVSGSPATSPGINMTVNPSLPASVNIAANPAGAICAGTSVIFTATPTNGGTTPTYQWKKGGVNIPGETGATYTTTTLANGDVITVTMTSNALCVSGSPATSPGITMTVNPSLPASVNIAANPAGAICAGTSVIFTATPTNGGTTPTYQWKKGGVNIPGETGATYTTTTLANGDVITVTMTSNALCVSGSPATSPGINMTVNPSVTPGITIAANPTGAICAGTSVTFSATPVNGGATPAYQWRINGANAGTDSPTFTSTTFNNGDVVSVVMTSNANCTTTPTATSAPVTMTVNASVTPGVSIAANPTGAICSGTSVAFTATPVNGGASPAYQWKINGINAGTNSPTFTSTTFANGDVVTVVMTSNAACTTAPTATSAPVTMTVNANVTPAVSVVASQTSICSGANVTFTATPTNGGAAPAYQWRVNAVNAGTDSPTFTSTTLANGDVITVVMTSNATCTTSPTATSAPVTMTVNASVTPAVTIVANPTGAICAGASVTFTATPVNGGATPTYQWRINGSNAGTDSPTFTSTTFNNGDVVTVVMTSNANCTTTPTATSASVTMTVNASVTPGVSIAANPTGAVCSGTSVAFTATPVNGGAAPSYQWQVNGVNAGTNSPTFTSTTFANGDVVTVVMTSNAACTTTPTATSAPVTVAVNASVTPAVSVVASQTSICVGASVTFTATPTNGGAAPSYQWRVNGVNAGTNSPAFTSTSIANGDVVTVVMTSNATCTTSPTATSTPVTMTVNASVTPDVTIAASPSGSVCTGTSVTFTATPINGGAAPTYLWQVNGITVPGETAVSFTTTTLANNDQVRVTMTSNAACTTSPTATSAPVTMTVNSITPSVSIVASQTSICLGASVTFTATPTNGGAAPTYVWQVNGITVPGQTAATFTTTTLADNDLVTAIMTSNAACTTTPTATSNTITMSASSITPAVSVAASQTSICVGASVTFTATPTNGGAAPTYVWHVNGITVPGQTAATFTTTTLADNDQVAVIMTSNASCTTTPTATSNTITMSAASITPAVSVAASQTSICVGASVTFTATPTNGGPAPTYEWQVNGITVTGQTAATFTTSTLANNDQVAVIMTSNASCTTTPTATSNTITITAASTTPSVSVAASQTSICAGASVTFTATPTNGGAAPTYEWQVNGITVSGQTAVTFTTTTLANNDQVRVTMTSNAACTTSPTATSTPVIMTVNTVTTSVSVVASQTSICVGASVTFTATPTNGGAAPTYEWQVNGITVSGQTAATFTTTTLADNDQVIVIMTSNASCTTTPTATSNTITMTAASITPAVSVGASQTTICSGASVTFTATPVNGGAAPSYQWRVNAVNGGTDSPTFTSTTLANGDVITVVMTSNATCTTSPTATSAPVTMTVNASVTPAVTIVANPTGAICAGASVTFTATPVNGGAAPSYQWRINGSNAGTDSPTFNSTTFNNGDVVTVVMTSNANCTTTPTATSVPVTMTVNASVTPGVSIAANPTAAICAGASVAFTATPVNGGAGPSYQWQVNGANAGTNSPTFTSTTLANGDIVTVVMTSNATCTTSPTATSAPVTMTVNASVTPAVSVVASQTSICVGASVTFNATPTNGGAAPSYQWRVNGVNAGTDSPAFTSTTLSNGDVVTVVMTSNATCITSPTATSAPVTMTVNASVTPDVSIAASPSGAICAGTSVTLTATPTNGGPAPAYLWQVNGITISGETAASFTTTTLANNDQVRVTMTSNAACTTSPTATSTPLTMTVNSVTPSVSIVASQTSICVGASVTFTATPTNGGAAPSYVWQVNGITVPGQTAETFTTTTLADNDQVTVIMTSNASCTTSPNATSNIITMSAASVTPSVSVAASQTSICVGASVTFTATPTNGGAAPTYVWQVNGIIVPGQTAETFTTTTLADNDQVRVIMTSNASCTTTPNATSNIITMSAASITPAVTIVASQTSICVGASVTFTATPTNGGAAPTYEWQINGITVPGQSAASFTTTALANNDQVRVIMTSNASCTTTPTATSNTITISAASVTPAVSVAASQTSICVGTSVTFTATPVNGGAAPSYEWQVNGITVPGQTAVTFTTTTLANNDQVRVTMTSNAACTTSPTATSTPITITVNTVTPSVSIVASQTSICVGASVTFTATPTNGGAAPTYEWQVNGITVPGQTAATFTTTSLADNDQIIAIMTSNAACVTSPTATSNTITMTAASITPSVSVVASQTTICSGASVTFTATPVNGGAVPSYQWRVNGINAGTDSPTFTSTTLANGDAVTVVMTSNATCTTTPNATSAPVTMTVNAAPIVTDQTGSVLSGASFLISPTGVPTGTTYTWSAPVITGGVTGGSAQATPQISITGTLTIPSGTGTATYSVIPASGTCIGAAFTVTITVTSGCVPVTIGTLPTDNNMCPTSGSASFSVIANGTAPFTYQWEYNNGGTWAAVVNGTPVGASYTNATASAMDVSGITSAGSYQYRSVITNCSGGNSITSAAATLIVNTSPSAPAVNVTQPTCTDATGTIVVTSTTTGLTFSLDAAPYVAYPAGGFNALASGPHTLTAQNAGGCISSITNITIDPQPETPIIADQTASILTGTAFNVTPATAPPGTTYTWSAPAYTGGVTGGGAQAVAQTNISGTLTVPSGTGTAAYIVTPALGACIGNPFTVTVTVSASCIPVTIGIQPTDNVMCSTSGIASFTVAANGTSPFIYQWEYNNGGTWEAVADGTPAGAAYTNATTATLDIAGITIPADYQYRAIITNCGGGNNAISGIVTLTVNATPSLSALGNNPVTCGANGSIDFTFTNVPDGSYTITYATGSFTNVNVIAGTASVTAAAGVYNNLEITAGSCTSAAGVNISIPDSGPASPVVGIITQPSSCATPTGSVPLSGLPGTGTWTINPGSIAGTGTTTTVTGLIPGTYNFTVTSGGCTSPATENVVIDPAPAAPPAPFVDAVTQPSSCALPTGSVTLSGLPGTGTWVINPGSIAGTGTTTTISYLIPGSYNFYVTSEAGCISPASATVVIDAATVAPPAPIIGTITQPASCAAPTGSVVLNGLPATGTWTINPGSIAGTGTTTTINLSPGTYTFNVTAEAGCISVESASVVINPAPVAPTAPIIGTITQPSSCIATTGSVVLNGLPATGIWTINPGSISGTGTSATISNLAPGTYNFDVTSDAGCISSPSAAVIIQVAPPAPTEPIVGAITQPSSCIATTGSVVLTGLPSTGDWVINPGGITGNGISTTITNLAPGTYNFTVYSDPGCISHASADVVINPAPVAPTAPVVGTITQPSSCSATTGSVILNGLPSTGTWIINPGAITGTGISTTISNLVPGTYNFSVTAEAGCISNASADVVISSPPVAPTAPIAETITQPSSCASSFGTVVLSGLPATGTWTINPGSIAGTGTTTTLSLSPGTYSFSVTSEAGCISLPSAEVFINDIPAGPLAPMVGAITQPSSCASPTGSVILSGLPATGTWVINPGSIAGTGSTTTITNLIPGSYNFYVTSEAGCISLASATVVINAAPVAPPAPIIGTITQPASCAAPTGSVVLNGLPATGTWTINPGSIAGTGSSTTLNLSPGTYSFNVTAQEGCISVESASVIINPAPAAPTAPIIGTVTQPSSCTSPTGSVVLNGLPATGTWIINPGSIAGTGTSTTILNLAPGTYNFDVTSDAGCISRASGDVIIQAAPSAPSAPVVGTITQPSSCSAPTGSVVLTGLPVSGTWTLNPGGITGNGVSTTITNLAPGTYNFTVYSDPGCISHASADIVINPAPVPPTAPIVGSITQPSSCSATTGSVVLNGLPSGTWTINPGAITGTGPSTTIPNLIPGTYNFSITSEAGCISNPSADVVINPPPPAPTAPVAGLITQPSSCGSPTGSVVLNGLPATGTWTINPGGITGNSTSTTLNLSPGTYRFNVTSDAGCISLPSTDIIIISPPGTPATPVIGAVTQPSSCTLPTGSVVLNGLPATGVWTINPGSITGTGTTTTVPDLDPGTYNFTVSVATGCSSLASSAVVINTPSGVLTAPVPGTITQPTCEVATGSVILTGLPTGTWTINPGAISGSGTSTTISELPIGTYNFTVTSDAGCISPASEDVVITAFTGGPAAPVIGSVAQPTCTDITGGIILTGLPTGTWTVNPGSITGSGASTTIPDLEAGTYNYTVTNDAGCTSPVSEDVIISAFPGSPLTPLVGVIIQPSCASATGSVILNGLPAGAWAINPGAITGTGSSTTITGLAAGTFNFTVTNGGGCISPATADVVIVAYAGSPAAPSIGEITQPTCQVGTGSVALNGLPAGGWTINPGAITGTGSDTVVTGLNLGTHTFMVTNESGCVSAASAPVTITAFPDAPATPVIGTVIQPVCTVATGSVTLDGLPAGNWTIEPGAVTGTGTSLTLTGLKTGPYNFSVINEAGCISAPSATVVFTPYPGAPETPVVEVTQPTCSVPTGSVLLTGLPSGSWTINPGSVTGTGPSASISGLSIGSHNFTVTNQAGCISEASSDILILAYPGAPTNPPSELSDYNGNNISCYGKSDGYIKINPAGDISQYTFSWSGPDGFVSTDKDISGLKAGQYVLTITDNYSCSAITDFVLTEPQQIGMTVVLSVSSDGAFNINCAGASTGSASITAVNSTGSVNYLWSDGYTGNNRSDMPAGTYGLIITDSNNCNADSTITLTAPDSLKLKFDVAQPFCPDNSDGSISLTVTGGISLSDYIYKWSDNSTGKSLQNISQGLYKVSIEDLNGCIVRDSVQVDPKNETCLIIPNAISPNGDLINDVWNITHIEQYPLAVIKIFNNWGVTVWRSEPGYPHPWDGRSNGIALPIDSYFYIIDLHNGSKPIAGNVTIIK